MNSHSDLSLINIQASALFVADPTGRLQYIREPGYAEAELDPAPRFWMGRTRTGNVWRFRQDVPDDLVRDVELLCRTEPVTVDFATLPTHAAAIKAALHMHMPITYEWRGPAYWIPHSVQTPAEVVLVSEANAHVLEAHFAWKRTSRSGFKFGPVTATVVYGSAVALCFCARLTEQAAEAGVETVEAERGRGYASAAVTGWAAAVRQRGLIPLYSTSWENVASQGVARKLGMLLYGEDWSIM
jgi:RimJ/RimL family protein N-acetyltransferase